MWGKMGDTYRIEGLTIQCVDTKNKELWNVLKTQ